MPQDHFVPITYLKHWGREDKKNAVSVCRKRNPNRWSLEVPKNICREKNGDINPHFQDPSVFPKMLQLTEQHWDKALTILVNGNNILPETKMYIAHGISRLLSLTPTKIKGIE